ncbi:MAG: hypothetical protein IJ580_07775, partial [Prevotella sp.]|nr:hypothetical protein [Prevotella sp.]
MMPYSAQQPKVTSPKASEANNLLPLYMLKPKGCNKYRSKNTMTQYIAQSLNQWLLCGNGYFRVRNDIALNM